MLWVWNILWLSICHWCFKSSYWRWWMVGRSILWSIGEEIFLIIFMTTLPNGIFSFMYWPQIQVKVGIFSSFFHSFLPPPFIFFPSFIPSFFLPPSLSPYLYHPWFLPLPSVLLVFLIFLFLFSSSSSFSSLYLKAQLWFNEQSPTATAYGRDTDICWSLVEPWTHVHRWNLRAPSFFFLEKAMATHSSTLAWKIPREEPGRLQSMGSLRVGHNWAASLSLHFAQLSCWYYEYSSLI